MLAVRSGEDTAAECAALAVLHQLQERHVALFGGPDGLGGALHEVNVSQDSGAVEVMHTGYGERRPIPPGSRVKVRYASLVTCISAVLQRCADLYFGLCRT